MAEKKFNEAFGALPVQYDIRDYKLTAPAMAVAYPEEFEVDMCAVKNQGSVGSCVAHSLSEVVEYYTKEQEKVTTKASTGFIYGNRRNSSYKGSGMYTREALSNLCKYGDVFAEEFSENVEVPKAINLFEDRFDNLKDKAYPNRITSYFRLYTDEEIKQALMNYGPVVFAMTWYKGTTVDSKGIMHVDTSKDKSGGHCMVIYGWNKDGWKIQNSWGTLWGKKGRAILPFDVKKSEVWGVTDTVTGENKDIIKPDYDTTFKRFIAKIINWFANLFRKKK